MKTSFVFWQKWLIIVCLFILLFGVGMAFFSGTQVFEIFHRQIDPAFWQKVPEEGNIREFQGWVYGVWGATLAGWGVFLTFLAAYPFRAREKWAWNCMASGLIVWFMLDTGVSLVYEVWFNVFVNSALFFLVGLPVGFTRKYFFEK
ncbi:MAG: hypothetical protein AB9891_07145 [Anaerolineaceae bacterium]